MLYVKEKDGTYRIAKAADIRSEARRLKILKSDSVEGKTFSCPAEVFSFVRDCISGPEESFLIIFVDHANRIISHEIISAGVEDQTAVYPRKVVREALLRYATGVIVAHNHPTGNVQPSPADREVTRQLKAACEPLEIRLLDHMIVGSGSDTYFSFRGAGLI